MNIELNTRAAKCLGWSIVGAMVRLPRLGLLDHFYMDEKYIFHVSGMQFTTSYDWAMLGVKAVNDKYYELDNYLDKLVKILGWSKGLREYYYGEDINSDDQVGEIVQATPEQITLAWVQVLEGETK